MSKQKSALLTAWCLLGERHRRRQELSVARAIIADLGKELACAQEEAAAEVNKRRTAIAQLKTAVEILDARYLITSTTDEMHSGAARIVLKIIADMER